MKMEQSSSSEAEEAEMREEALKYALLNALKYGEPDEKAVIKRILAEHPEWRKSARELRDFVREAVSDVAEMSKEEREAELMRLSPELAEELRGKERRKEEAKAEREGEEVKLPPLPNAERGKVVMRFAPNPNGAATLGSARGIVTNAEYARIYEGKFILRFDDTDPALKRPLPEAYDWYLEDCEWLLGAPPDEVVVASERIPLYYEHAVALIQKGAAYVCECPRETFKRLKDAKMACKHRELSVEENLERWERMLAGEYEEGEAVLRIKTDMRHEDPAMRDWVAFRILKREHPRVGDRFCVWPTLDFESAIEDHLLGITHILRGKDLQKSEGRQRFIYRYFGWKYPVTILWGKIKVAEFGKFSTSELRRRIERGEFEGWDDPRLPTIRALRRRGFQPEAIRKFLLSLGVSQADIAVSMKNLYAENRKIVDAFAPRYFFVHNPQKMTIKGFTEKTVKAQKHPERQEFREINTKNVVFISESDFRKLKVGMRIRLKFLCDVEVESVKPLVARVVSERHAEESGEEGGGGDHRRKPIIHWAPTESIEVRVKKPDGTVDEGLGEPLIASELGKVVQFERYAFVRIDTVSEDGKKVVAYFTH